MPHRRSPSPTRNLSLCCSQIKAWKAGHKGICAPAGGGGNRSTAAKQGKSVNDLVTQRGRLLTADQLRVLETLQQLSATSNWRGVAAQEPNARAVAASLRTSMPDYASFVYCTLGNAFDCLGDCSKAIEYHGQRLEIAKEVGDRAGEGGAYGNLGNAYKSAGKLAMAIECHVLDLSIAKEVGDRPGQGRAYANLGIVCKTLGDFNKAIEYHTLCLAIAKEVGDRAGEGRAYGNLGNVYQSQGDYSKAVEYHTQHLATAKELGDRAGEGMAYGNMGNAYYSLGDFGKAIEYHAQDLAIAKEVGDRAGEGMAYANLGTNHMCLNEYVRALACFEAQHAMAISLKLTRMQSDAALNIGVTLTLEIRAARKGPATGADQVSGAHSHSPACLNDRVREAEKWLRAAVDSGHQFAKLHLAHLVFYAGQEDAALAHLKEHLSWRVQRGRVICAGCGQMRGEDTPMLTCSGCRVARFCSADHQKMASKKSLKGGSLLTGRHKDICGVLSKWREVVKDGVAPDSCTVDLVAFLQR